MKFSALNINLTIHKPVIAFTTMSETSGISSLTGTHSIWGVTQCKALGQGKKGLNFECQGHPGV